MNLTPIDHAHLDAVLPGFLKALGGHGQAIAIVERVVATTPPGDLMTLSTERNHHDAAVAHCRAFGLGVVDRDPKDGFSWDGTSVSVGMEPSVVIHEVAHYQCAAPWRRTLPDYGLGRGPETGIGGDAADAVKAIFGVDGDVEEGMASLLGILWEVELGQPAVLAFIEQNWLEGGADTRNARHLIRIVEALNLLGVIDEDGRPRHALRTLSDAAFADWRASL